MISKATAMIFAATRRASAAALVVALTLGTARGDDRFSAPHARMIEAIRADAALTRQWTDQSELDPRVIETLGRVPRHSFVSPRLHSVAYENRPLPIGWGQTISQPFIVALMTDILRVAAGDIVLEVGTGSGYQAAVLADLGVEVRTIEIIAPLATAAAARLRRLGYDRVIVRHGDGYHGWPEQAPFDAIIVTAAATHVPPPLIRQLKPSGRLVIPVGQRFQVQQLLLVEKNLRSELRLRQILPVAFVPLTGGHD